MIGLVFVVRLCHFDNILQKIYKKNCFNGHQIVDYFCEIFYTIQIIT